MLKSETPENSKRARRTLTADNAPSRLIRRKELRNFLTGLGKSTIHRLISEGRFPAQVHPFGHSRVAAWRSTDVSASSRRASVGRPRDEKAEAAEQHSFAVRRKIGEGVKRRAALRRLERQDRKQAKDNKRRGRT